MGDIADILGLSKPSSSSDDALRFLDDKPKHAPKKAIAKPKGMSREVFMLHAWDSLLPAAPSASLSVGLKDKRQLAAQGRWVWEEFANSARTDGQRFYHWTKVENVGSEYPWAKFNSKMELVKYSDEEYNTLLVSPDWTRAETDSFMQLVHAHDMRWPVVFDRYESSKPRRVEELQFRFYDIVSKLKTYRLIVNPTSSIKIDASLLVTLDYEVNRRLNQERYFHKFKEDDATIGKIKDEIATCSSKKKARSNKSKADVEKTAAGVGETQVLEPAAITLVPQPCAGKPCLQSSRFVVDTKSSASVPKTLLAKLGLLLGELELPDPIPTRTTADMVDHIKRNSLGLLSIQAAIKAKEKKIEAMRRQMEGQVSSNPKIQLPIDAFVAPAPPPTDASTVQDVSVGNSKKKKTIINKKKKRGGFGEGSNNPSNKKFKLDAAVKVEKLNATNSFESIFD